MPTIETIACRGWPNCRRVTNGSVELIATTDVGPRIIHFGFAGKTNLLKQYDDMMGRTGGDEWRLYGGHRLWHAPEQKPRTYCPDNGPVEAAAEGGVLRLTQPVEPTTGIRKQIEVRMADRGARVTLTHRLTNANLWTVPLAPWSPTVMAPGGRCIIPLPPRGSHDTELLPTNTLVLWAYTDLTDPRWTLGRKYVMLQQDPQRPEPQKIGASVPDGWVACAIGGQLFVKKFRHVDGAEYPDMGCSVETFTDGDMIEVETLGPMVTLAPGATVEHVEDWFLFDDVAPADDDDSVDRDVLPKVRAAKVE